MFSQYPLYLSHASGMSVLLFDHIIRYVQSGMNFKAIEKILSNSLYDAYLRRKGRCNIKSFPTFKVCFKTSSPIDDFIKKCFVINYSRYKLHYKKHFESVPVTGISCNGIFKTAPNVGYSKDGKWIKQYNSLFVILNKQSLFCKISQITDFFRYYIL